MSQNYPQVIPMLSYENGPAAMDWLMSVFGFQERTRILSSDGSLSHGELSIGISIIMLATPTPHYESPKHHREHCQQAKDWSSVPWVIDGVLVYVDDLEAHFNHVKASGAKILSGIETDDPGKRYRVEDLEGHRWFFFQKE